MDLLYFLFHFLNMRVYTVAVCHKITSTSLTSKNKAAFTLEYLWNTLVTKFGLNKVDDQLDATITIY